MKLKDQDRKHEKSYLKKMSPKNIEKIGSQTLLDKKWADRPLNVIKNPHKLSEIELYSALQKVVEMPEKRLKHMLKETHQQAIDEVFLSNIIERLPQFLTTTIVNITKTLLIQKDYFKDHPIWNCLELELFRRRNNLNNEQLASIIHAFGVSGAGSKQFYNDLEETIIDSPINIESEHLIKILIGYSQIDQGTPVLYSDTVERLILRGIENLSLEQILEVVKCLAKATNVHKGGFGFYEAMEKYYHNGLHQGKVNFNDLVQIAEVILPLNIGKNEFHLEIEDFLLKLYSTENLQEVTNLVRGLGQYQIKTQKLEILIYKTVERYVNDFTQKQLETLIWSFSRNLQNQQTPFKDLIDYKKDSLTALIQRVKQKCPSFKPRGVAFAIESLSNLNYKDEDTYKRMEKVVLAKLDELIPHYLVKIMNSYYKVNLGSGELYDKLIQGILQTIVTENLNYSDMLRFFEVFPEVSYIYETAMNEELYLAFTQKIKSVIKDKKFPTEDACRVFNILVRIHPYSPKKEDAQKENQKFLFELMGKLRHSIFDIPKEYFTQTMANLVEFQQPELATKFLFIIQELVKTNKLISQEFNLQEQIYLFWSMMQIEKAFKESLISSQNLQFLNIVDISTLKPREFLLFKQLVSLVSMWDQSKSIDGRVDQTLDYSSIYTQIQNLSKEKREEFINEDSATKTQPGTTQEIYNLVKKSKRYDEVQQNFSDDLMNLINIAMNKNKKLYGILILNDHCFIDSMTGEGKLMKRTVELKKQQFEELFDWTIYTLEEQKFHECEDKEEMINQILGQKTLELGQNESEDEKEEVERKGGRKVKKMQRN